jgi:hypothetical protein
MAWRPPELPPVQRLPKRPKGDGKPSKTGRIIAGIAGVAFGAAAIIGLWRALNDRSGQGSPFGPLAMLLPAALLIRYALTGQIKVN